MILTCPACATQYRLKEGAIPPEGRTVRCAACKHKWHQDGEAGDAVDAVAARGAETGTETGADTGAGLGGPPQPDARREQAPSADIPDAAAHEQMIAEVPEPEVAAPYPGASDAVAADDAGSDRPFAARPYGGSAAEEWAEPADRYAIEEHGFSSIPAMHDDDEPPRRSKLGWIVGLILLVIAAAAAFWFLAPPELKARAGIAEAGESPLQLMLTTSDRQKLASGNELLAISGRVINTTDREQAVPPIHAELRDPTSNKLVYQRTIAPPARSLAPGAAASFNSAEVDVPQGGESLSLRFAS